MSYFISALIGGMKNMEEVAEWIDSKPYPDLGVELIAFTHQKEYWNRLTHILDKLHCPVSFHGPYVGTEGTSPRGSKEQAWLIESYDRVMKLAARYEVAHIVYHYTQKGRQASEKEKEKKYAKENLDILLDMADSYQVDLLIENLPFPKAGEPLFDNKEYSELFNEYKVAHSILDIGHAHMNQMDIEEYLKSHSRQVRAYHFHNNNGSEDQHNRMSDGTFSFEAFSKVYGKYTPSTNIVLEYEPHTNLGHEDLLEDLYKLQSMFG